MYILGISCFYHDSAACLLKDGVIVAAAEEERFTRKKHDSAFPQNAILYCLEKEGITGQALAMVVFYEKPLLKFERILEMVIEYWPRSFMQWQKAMPLWFKEKLWIVPKLKEEIGYKGKIYFAEHHLSHAASAFFTSPFDSAAILTVDGVGEWTTLSIGRGNGTNVEIIKEIHFPHSLGMLYSTITGFLGFKVNSAEYKVMGAAPYGKPVYYEQMMKLINIGNDSSIALNLKYFKYYYGLKMFNKWRLQKLFGVKARLPESKLEQVHFDIASSLQKVTNEIMIRLAKEALKITNEKNLCLAGGVALNCVANGQILKEVKELDDIFIQPASGDAGGAIGAAYIGWHTIAKQSSRQPLENVYLGPEYKDVEIKKYFDLIKIPYTQLDREKMLERVVDEIIAQKVIGWFQGRMEFGPRALGNRSILADARQEENRDKVNLKIKFRESFRPFAPSILFEMAKDYFNLEKPSPYMLLVGNVLKNTTPATTHVDGSARVQTVTRKQNQLYYDLITRFFRKTGTPILINTSFNVRGEPIVMTPQDAIRVFLTTHMDILAIGNFIIDKEVLLKVQYIYQGKINKVKNDD